MFFLHPVDHRVHLLGCTPTLQTPCSPISLLIVWCLWWALLLLTNISSSPSHTHRRMAAPQPLKVGVALWLVYPKNGSLLLGSIRSYDSPCPPFSCPPKAWSLMLKCGVMHGHPGTLNWLNYRHCWAMLDLRFGSLFVTAAQPNLSWLILSVKNQMPSLSWVSL